MIAGGLQSDAGPAPVHVLQDRARTLYYVPALLCVVDATDSTAAPDAGVVQRLGQARATLAAAEAAPRAFAPECLTVYVNNRCHLRCAYCFSDLEQGRRGATVDLPSLQAAAETVAASCAQHGLPLTVAFHGGGEPTADPRLLRRMVERVADVARRHSVGLSTYVATNGAVPRARAQWLAETFDLVGVSCDGPPDIQNRSRPDRAGRPTSGAVERTLGVLTRSGRRFHVRCTVRDQDFPRQVEIVDYLTAHWTPGAVHLEPVYANRSGCPTAPPALAAGFADNFMAARALGRTRGVAVDTSITRPAGPYGRYCNVLRNVLNLVPGGVATACFLHSRADTVAARGLAVGAHDSAAGVFRLDAPRWASLAGRCASRPPACATCLCSHQCTHGCPDACVFDTPAGAVGGFRCHVNRQLMERMLREAAERAWTAARPGAWSNMQDTETGLAVAVRRRAEPERKGAP